MASFPSINPSYNMQKRSRPSVRSVQFGDGYTQRIIWGENQNPKVWNLDWRNISEADSDTIETFLDARGGKEGLPRTAQAGPLMGELSEETDTLACAAS